VAEISSPFNNDQVADGHSLPSPRRRYVLDPRGQNDSPTIRTRSLHSFSDHSLLCPRDIHRRLQNDACAVSNNNGSNRSSFRNPKFSAKPISHRSGSRISLWQEAPDAMAAQRRQPTARRSSPVWNTGLARRCDFCRESPNSRSMRTAMVPGTRSASLKGCMVTRGRCETDECRRRLH
jgi:hypothetical protein